MRPGARPRLLGHLRDMLAEREEDIVTLQGRLRQSEEFHRMSVARMENLEAQLDPACRPVVQNPEKCDRRTLLLTRLEAIERVAVARGLSIPAVPCDAVASDEGRGLDCRVAALERALEGGGGGEAAGGCEASDLAVSSQPMQQLVDKLREQLSVSNAGRAALAGETDRWRSEAEALRRENDQLRIRLAQAEQEAAAREGREAPATREADALRTRLRQTVQETSLLRSQLAARGADILRLERRCAELEGLPYDSQDTATRAVGGGGAPGGVFVPSEGGGGALAPAAASAVGLGGRPLDESWHFREDVASAMAAAVLGGGSTKASSPADQDDAKCRNCGNTGVDFLGQPCTCKYGRMQGGVSSTGLVKQVMPPQQSGGAANAAAAAGGAGAAAAAAGQPPPPSSSWPRDAAVARSASAGERRAAQALSTPSHGAGAAGGGRGGAARPAAPSGGVWTPPPPVRVDLASALGSSALGSRARSPGTRIIQTSQPTAAACGGVGGVTASTVVAAESSSFPSRLSSAPSVSAVLDFGATTVGAGAVPSPQHGRALSAIDGASGALVLPRSQSVPVQLRHNATASPMLATSSAVSLARWAASPGSSRSSGTQGQAGFRAGLSPNDCKGASIGRLEALVAAAAAAPFAAPAPSPQKPFGERAAFGANHHGHLSVRR